MPKKPNIILITIDSLRARNLGFMGYKKNISPNLDKLAKDSTVFTSAYVVGPNSSHSFPSILTSTYPLDYQALHIDENRELLSEALKKQGYLTACLQTSPFLSSYFGYNRGWDFFEDISIPVPESKFFNPHSFKGRFQDILIRLSINTSPHIFFGLLYLRNKIKSLFREAKPYKTGAVFINQIIKDFISANKDGEKPFFLWAHYQDVHGPFIPYDCRYKDRPLSYSELIGRNLPTLIANYPSKNKSFKKFARNHIGKTVEFYEDGIRYFDEQFGDLFNFMEKENIGQETILCITADHGDELLEHGGVGHYDSKLYNEILNVPLMFKIPGQAGKRIENNVSLIDLPSTLCDLVGIGKPASYKGKNLFENKEEFIFHQASLSGKKDFWRSIRPGNLENCLMSCQSKDWKYIHDYSIERKELYDLEADKEEQNDLAKENPEIVVRMEEKIREFLAKNPVFPLEIKSQKYGA
jgi:arylsulfatase A-like enzyme